MAPSLSSSDGRAERHKMLRLQGQTISAGKKSAACQHLAHMGRLSRQLNQHIGISRFVERNVRDADGLDVSADHPSLAAPRLHVRAAFVCTFTPTSVLRPPCHTCKRARFFTKDTLGPDAGWCLTVVTLTGELFS